MSGDPTFTVLASYRDWLSQQMPVQPEIDRPVPVYYGHPGDNFPGTAIVWFGGAEAEYQVKSLRATTSRRVATVEFDIGIGVVLQGKTDDEQSLLQRRADAFCASIRDIVDEDLATEEHLHRPDLVDVAWVVRSTTTRGPLPTGVGSGIVLRIGFKAEYV